MAFLRMHKRNTTINLLIKKPTITLQTCQEALESLLMCEGKCQITVLTLHSPKLKKNKAKCQSSLFYKIPHVTCHCGTTKDCFNVCI